MKYVFVSRSAREPRVHGALHLLFLALGSTLALLAFAAPLEGGIQDEQEEDPEVLFETRLRMSLVRHKYFKHVDIERVDEGPYIFLVQKPAKADADYARTKAESYASLYAPVQAAFEERFVRPFDLVHRRQRYVIAILATTGDFDNYARAVNATWHYRSRVFYDRRLGAAIVHESPISPRDRAEEVHSARHALVHAMQAAIAETNGDLSSWAFEAMAHDLASRGRMDWDRERTQKQELRRLLLDGGKDELQRTHLLALGEFLNINHPGRLAAYLKKTAGIEFAQALHSSAFWSFYRQGALLHSFFLEELDGKYGPAYKGFLAGAFEGRETPQHFLEAMGRFRPEEIDADFRTWMDQVYRATWPDDELDGGALEEEVVVVAADANAGSAETSAPPKLNLAQVPSDAHLGWALACMRRGAAGEALEHLDRAEARATVDHQRERIARARARVDAWIDARRFHLEVLAARGSSIYLPLDGKKRKVSLREVGEMEIVVDGPRSPGVRIDVDTLDPKDLARRMKNTLPDELQWVRAYVGFLDRDPKWPSAARGAHELEGLKKDEASLEEILAAGDVAEQLFSLARMQTPRNVGEGEANLAAITAIRREHGERPMVSVNDAALDALARRQAGALFEKFDPWSHLRGRVQSPGGNRVRIIWEFEDASELEDFHRQQDYLKEQHKHLGGDTSGEGFRVEGGELLGDGEDCLYLPIDLAAPLDVRYELTLGSRGNPPENEDKIGVGVCDDRAGRFAWLLDCYFLELYTGTGLRKSYYSSIYYPGVAYNVRLSHDGTHLRHFLEDDELGAVAADRSEGALFLWIHSSSLMRIARLEVEGELTGDPLAGFRRHWVERRVAATR